MFLFNDYPMAPFRSGELYFIRDLILSNNEENLKKVFNKLVALNFKKALPKRIAATKDLIDAIFVNERQKTIDTIKNSIPFLNAKLWEKHADLHEEIKANKHKADLTKLNDEQLHILLISIFDFFKENYWNCLENVQNNKKQNLIEYFKYSVNSNDYSRLFEQSFFKICSILLPDLINVFLTEEKPYGIEFTDKIIKNSNKFFSILLKKEPTLSQTISLMIFDEKKMNGEKLIFLDRFTKLFGETIKIQEPLHSGHDNMWPPLPIGEVYGKNTTDLTLNEDMFCEVYFVPQKQSQKEAKHIHKDNSKETLSFNIPVFAPVKVIPPEPQPQVPNIVIQKPVKSKGSLFDKK